MNVNDWLLDKDKTSTKEELLVRVAQLRYKLASVRGVLSKLDMDIVDYHELIQSVFDETNDDGLSK